MISHAREPVPPYAYTTRPPPNYASLSRPAATMKYSSVHSAKRPRNTPQHHFTVVGNGAMFGP